MDFPVLTDKEIGEHWRIADTRREPSIVKECLIRIVVDKATFLESTGYSAGGLKEACRRLEIPYREFVKYAKERRNAGG